MEGKPKDGDKKPGKKTRKHSRKASSNAKRKKKHASSRKRKSSQKPESIFPKENNADHVNKTIAVWKQRWKNKAWKQKWKTHWGKGKWKASIRKKWNTDKKWRRKWMKKILKQWWDKKWRRKWMKRWIDNRWLSRWNKKRLRRKRLWKMRWRRSGAKKMGLTFNDFLLFERRLKALQRVPQTAINQRRKEKKRLREKLLKQKLRRQEKFDEELKTKRLCEKWYHILFNREYLGPETFGIRPSVIQFKFYMLNMVHTYFKICLSMTIYAVLEVHFVIFIQFQGLVAFIIVLYYHITSGLVFPPELTLQGLYTIVYFANAMDFYGSLFGMITSFHLESYYGHHKDNKDLKRKSKGGGLFSCCRKKDDLFAGADAVTLHKRQTTDSLTTTYTSTSQTNVKNLRQKDGTSTRRRSSRPGASRESDDTRSEDRRPKRHSSVTQTLGRQRRQSKKEKTSKASVDPSPGGNAGKAGAQLKVTCQCRGLGFLYCCVVRQCFRPGRSREFINRMGYCSWILLQLAWFFNIYFTAYYTWLELYSKDYQLAAARCRTPPQLKHCEEWDSLYIFLFTVVAITFMLRNIFLFVVGMCFPERYLRRCESTEPDDEMASTCSDTDIDYTKVPKQLLVPHLLSAGKYPYVLPGPCRPVDYMLKKITQVTEKYKKANKGKFKRKLKRKKGKTQRRVLSCYEKEYTKLVAGIKQVRRAARPLPMGQRAKMRIPVSSVQNTDFQQLPPELMTPLSRAWLYDDETSDVSNEKNVKYRTVKWRKRRDRKVDSIDSATLTVIKQPVRQPVDEEVKLKMEHLSDTDTDKSWSGSDSLFENISGYSSKDDAADDEDDDNYLELLRITETLDNKKSDSEISFKRTALLH